jgi:flagellin-like protein
MENKRGISPLIATLLLIAFTVALGAMIMNWGSTWVSPECDNIKLEIPMIQNTPTFCYDETTQYLKIIIKNSGTIAVDGILFRSINENLQISEVSLENSKIDSGGILRKDIFYKKSEKFKVEFIPKIIVNNQEKLCTGQTLSLERFTPCPAAQ